MMKILILVDSLKIGGGSDKVAAILGSKLHKEGYEVTFLTLSDEGPNMSLKGIITPSMRRVSMVTI